MGVRVLVPFFSNRCGLAILHNFTAGNRELVLTTYMAVALFLERPALLSATQPQTRPSYCTANTEGESVQQRIGMQIAYDPDSVNSAKSSTVPFG